MDDFLHAREDPPGPPVRQAARGHFRVHDRSVLPRLLEDVEGPQEVDVRRLPRMDLLLRGDVEVTTPVRVRHGVPAATLPGAYRFWLDVSPAERRSPYSARISAARTVSRRETRSSGMWMRAVSPGPKTAQRGLCAAYQAISVAYVTATTSVRASCARRRTCGASKGTP